MTDNKHKYLESTSEGCSNNKKEKNTFQNPSFSSNDTKTNIYRCTLARNVLNDIMHMHVFNIFNSISVFPVWINESCINHFQEITLNLKQVK